MRQHLISSFDSIFVYDLHGNSNKKETCPDGSKDEMYLILDKALA
jgi:hypothetical protein